MRKITFRSKRAVYLECTKRNILKIDCVNSTVKTRSNNESNEREGFGK